MAELINKNSFGFVPGVSEEEAEVFTIIKTGEYTGNGQASQYIDLEKKPKAVIIMQDGCITAYQDDNWHCGGGMAFDGSPLVFANNTLATIENTGFTVVNATTYISLNRNSATYRYIAFM